VSVLYRIALPLLIFLLAAPILAAPSYEVVTPETPYPELTAPRVFWPLIRDDFLAAPLPEDHFGWVRRRKIGHVDDLQNQATLLESATDPSIRSRTVTLLGSSMNRHAGPVLIDHLAREQDSRVIADLLRALGRIEAADSVADFAMLLGHEEAMVRYEAARLLADTSKPDLALIRSRLPQETDSRVSANLLRLLVQNVAETSLADWQATLAGDDVRLKQIAIQGLLNMPAFAAEEARVLALCGDRNPAIRLAVITQLPPSATYSDTVLEKLVADPNSGIRSQCAIFIAHSPAAQREALLHTLASDKTGSPRQEAAGALAKYATGSAIDRLFLLTGDPLSLVRHQAEASLLGQPDSATIDRIAGESLAHESDDRRYHASRLLDRLGSTQHIAVLAPLLASESRPKNLAAVIDALVTAGAKRRAEPIANLLMEQPPVVQSAAVRAITAFDTKSAFDNMRELALLDGADEQVRRDVVEAMGRLGHGEEFAKTLLDVLKATNPEKPISGPVRAIATWSTSRLDEPGDKLIKRLSTQVVSKVVPIPGNPPDFDSEQVRIGACWALVHLAKREIKGASKGAKRIVQILRSPLDSPTAGDMAITHRMLHLAYQAQQYWDDAAVTREDIPNYPFRFDFRRNKTR
jgi:HEAT repeat protein